MRCPIEDAENPEVLLDYCAHKLDPETTALLESHIADCARCREFSAGQKQVWSALDKWDDPPVTAGFDQRLYARIEAEKDRSWRQHFFGGSFGWKPAVPIAAVCATAALAFFLNMPVTNTVTVPKQEATRLVESLQVEQVEQALDDVDMLRQLGSSGLQPL